ncbi:alpha-amylase family glycosyl hydrolase [Aporhodopirellula aestuarii]|uniref:Alpha-amylase family glycosyl hydrolase n=1 Tax=Aporhodopirellula aestuarii TaxID=2950107 RepID=A0ABT0UFB5_9BACT|nr:alpha-amylase family glycosyl hydrolase [Aporhodopirellula aestuarii]MCM2375040.1 alpha-amylase family glycosyl hydrolase [Aporhodopirellula aestuarii]
MKTASRTASEYRWWETGVIYQIYPRSFQDSNADGVGDLGGIERRLDYLVSLGIDAIWMSPIYPSPMADFGYDVADYCDIDPIFGDLHAFDHLLAAVHARGLKLLLDFVPNHSSDQHPWFVESRSSRDNPKRDWYIWRDPSPDGGPPNNWISDFGGSSWEWDATTQQFYLHAFLPQQPDLNWRHPELRDAMMGVLRFWFDRGVDGFRMDVLWHIVKDVDLRDNPINPNWTPIRTQRDRLIQLHSTDQPEAHEIAAEFRALADSYGDRVLIGEISLPNERLARWFGTKERPQVHLPVNFHLIESEWNAESLAQMITDYDASLPEFGWPNWVLGSHDARRIAARVGDAQSRVAAMLLLTLRGTPTLYQGDEIGIGEVPIPRDRVRDPQDLRQPDLGIGRDRSRTPMPWNDSAHAGFSTVDPWLPLNPDWRRRNVASQDQDPKSLLSLYQTLLALRRTHTALAIGALVNVESTGDVLSFVRQHDDERLLIVLNIGNHSQTLPIPNETVNAKLQCSTAAPQTLDGTLAPNEGLILQLIRQP